MSNDIVWGIWSKDCIDQTEGWLLDDYGEPLGPMTYDAAMKVVRRLWLRNFRTVTFSPKLADFVKTNPRPKERPGPKDVRKAASPAPPAIDNRRAS